MNKIEAAINDVKMKIKNAKQKVLIAEAEYKCLEDVLERLEIIERKDSIPHVEVPQEKINIVNFDPHGTGVIGVRNLKDFDKNKTYTQLHNHTDTQNKI